MSRVSTPRRWRLGAAIAVVVLGACGNDDESTSPPTSASTTQDDQTLVVDWTGTFETGLPNGWMVRDCEGDRTNVCVYDGDDFLGDIELVAGYPLESGDEARDPQIVAQEAAADMVTHFRADRAQGCATFTFEAEPVSEAVVGGEPGARSGFTLTDNSGRVVERVINYYAIVGDQMSIINTDAYVEEGGCLGPSETDPSFTPDNLAQLEPHLDNLIANSPATPD